MTALFQFSDAIANAVSLTFVFGAVAAVAGVFVAYQAYRGYRRNESRPMLFLAVAIVLLTAIPVGVDYMLATLTIASDAAILLVVTAAHLAGVVAILYALTRA